MGLVWDSVTEARIKSLHPLIRDKATRFIKEAEKEGIYLRITSGFRSFEEQDGLFNSGKDVTNAKGGSSYHNYGLAIDVVEMVGGKPVWDSPNWPKIGKIGKAAGFEWGGDWNLKNSKMKQDLPHFQITQGKTTKELLALHNAGKFTNGFLNIV